MSKNKFIRQGLIYKVEPRFDWMQTHCQVPFAYMLNEKTVRFYFATRDVNNRSSTTFIEADAANPNIITYIHDLPCLSPGELGTFDDSGAMPSWFIRHNDKIYLYYSGWNAGGSVPYRMGIGLAISKDNGITFKKISSGPIMDRSTVDTYWVSQPCVMKQDNIWKMWYLSCTHWSIKNNHPEPHYNVKYAESKDGINWERNGIVSLSYDEFTEAIGRPVVIQEEGIYKMYFSYRNSNGYRTNPEKSYRLGYAESIDGVHFEKVNKNFEILGKRKDWESIMNEYCHLYTFEGVKYIIYNGNGFGKSGFGYATLFG
jgi:hypothetical protein